MRFVLFNNIAVPCILRGEYPNICIYAPNSIPAPLLLQICLRPCSLAHICSAKLCIFQVHSIFPLLIPYFHTQYTYTEVVLFLRTWLTWPSLCCAIPQLMTSWPQRTPSLSQSPVPLLVAATSKTSLRARDSWTQGSMLSSPSPSATGDPTL